MSVKHQCAVCDKITSSLDNKGFCYTCAAEFEQVRQRLHCYHNECKTPLSCLIAKRCLSQTVTQGQLFPT